MSKSQIIQGAGHHVYADKKEFFNDIVSAACTVGDKHTKEVSSDVSGPENSEIIQPPITAEKETLAAELNNSTAPALSTDTVNLNIKDSVKDSAVRD